MKRLLLAAAIIALVAFALRKRDTQRQAWTGLSETEAREKLDQKLPNRIPEDKRAAVTDKIVDRMRDRGVVVADADAETEADTDDDAEVDIDLTEQPEQSPAGASIPTT